MNDTLEANFNSAMNMSCEDYDYDKLIALLQSEKIVQKQFAALNLTEIKSSKDAEILVSNLIGQDGKVREAVAFKINELMQNAVYKDFFVNEKIYPILAKGIMDINGNVCRQIVNIALIDENFGQYLCKELPEMLREIWREIEQIDLKSKQYVVNKRNFQLYWCLEALYNIVEIIDFETIKDIVIKAGGFYDYTIREKIAKILTKLDNLELNELKEKLKNDENYYVRKNIMPDAI